MAVEGFEESLGLDPNDPLVPFLLFLGLSVTLWYKNLVLTLFFLWFQFFLNDLQKLHFLSDLCRGSYRLVKYRGYAGDLSPQSTLKLLQGNENAVLVDIRPEVYETLNLIDFLCVKSQQMVADSFSLLSSYCCITKNIKERDGVPDLRRAARFRYASVTLPEVAPLFYKYTTFSPLTLHC